MSRRLPLFGLSVGGLLVVALGALVGLGVFRQGQAAQPTEVVDSSGVQLVRIRAGEFLMGCEEPAEQLLAVYPAHKRVPDDIKEEYPRHRVCLTRDFYMGKYEVTVGQFRRFVEETGYRTEPETDGEGGWGFNPKIKMCEGRKPQFAWHSTGWPQTDQHPVSNVTWNDAVRFCEWLSKKEGVTYRLPTEAEWEYCCRAGTTTRYHNGDDPTQLALVGRVADPTGYEKFPHIQDMVIHNPGPKSFTVSVGSYPANAWGLHDMHGNVWEWCSDWQDDDYYAVSPLEDPKGPEKSNVRVRRGGGWNTFPIWARASFRNFNTPVSRISNLGFRVVREIPEPASTAR